MKHDNLDQEIEQLPKVRGDHGSQILGVLFE